jgi:hypothetical protein
MLHRTEEDCCCTRRWKVHVVSVRRCQSKTIELAQVLAIHNESSETSRLRRRQRQDCTAHLELNRQHHKDPTPLISIIPICCIGIASYGCCLDLQAVGGGSRLANITKHQASALDGSAILHHPRDTRRANIHTRLAPKLAVVSWQDL